MIDITHKNKTLRIAMAQASVALHPQSISAIKNRSIPKGDVLEQSKAAALLAVKNTPYVIPNCHPLFIESTDISFQLDASSILISVTVKTIYKTGVEVEAMHGAAIAALTLYDMVKPIDKHIEITSIRLVDKKGGKSDARKLSKRTPNTAVIVCSDSVSKGEKEDSAGKAIIKKLEDIGLSVSHYKIIEDDIDLIRKELQMLCDKKKDMIIITGGTGLSKRDATPEAIIPLLDRRMPGVEEAIRSYGQERTPYAMLSRSVAGFKGNTLVLALPGSTKGASQSIDAIFPALLHVFDTIENFSHDEP